MLRVFFVPFSARVLVHLGPVGRPVRIMVSLGSQFLFGGAAAVGVARLELGISYMYTRRAWHSGWLISRVGGTAWVLGLAAMYGREDG